MGPLRRRTVLGAVGSGVAVVLAGCGGHTPKLQLEFTSPADLPSRASRSIEPDASSDELRPLVRTIEQGTRRIDARGSELPLRRAEPVVDDPVAKPVAFRGNYYAISLGETVPNTFREVALQVEEASEAADEADVEVTDAIDYAELPAADRRAIDRAVPLPEETGIGSTVVALYDGAETASSVLVPDQAYDTVLQDGDRYSVRASTQARGVSGHTYRYEAERVASTEAAFLEWLRPAYRWEMTGLSDAEREIVEAAAEEDGYDDGDGEAFRSLSAKFFERPTLERDGETGVWLVRFDGEEYLAEFPEQRALD